MHENLDAQEFFRYVVLVWLDLPEGVFVADGAKVADKAEVITKDAAPKTDQVSDTPKNTWADVSGQQWQGIVPDINIDKPKADDLANLQMPDFMSKADPDGISKESWGRIYQLQWNGGPKPELTNKQLAEYADSFWGRHSLLRDQTTLVTAFGVTGLGIWGTSRLIDRYLPGAGFLLRGALTFTGATTGLAAGMGAAVAIDPLGMKYNIRQQNYYDKEEERVRVGR